MSSLDLIAVTAFGLESVVVRELAGLGYEAKPVATGRVAFAGDALALARCNLRLRACERMLVRVGEFPARDFGALFDGVQAMPWEEWIGPDGAFPVAGRSVKSQLSSVPACQKIVKKAIVERLRRAHRVTELPEIGAAVSVEVSLRDDVAILTIDSSGAGLHKRGYRALVGEAALKETLAAGLVLLSVWTPDRPLIDPFCGTGTIAIEAAQLALGIAPGLARTFDAERWRAIPETAWREARAEAADLATSKSLRHTIHASDIDEHALALARQHARNAGVERHIHFVRRDVRDLESRADSGVVITNPPYGVRLRRTAPRAGLSEAPGPRGASGRAASMTSPGASEDVIAIYRVLPDVFRKMPTWSFHILTAVKDLESIVGQQATRRRKLFNSQIECTYFSFLGPKPASMRRQPGGPDEDELNSLDETATDAIEQDVDVVPEARENGVGRPPDGGEDPAPGQDHAPGQDDQSDSDQGQPTGQGGEEERTREHRARDADGAGVAKARSARVSEEPVRDEMAPAFGGLRERDRKEAAEFGACLRNNARHLRRWPTRQGITCYRLYERDCPDVPLIVDRYEDRVHVVELEREHSRTPAQHLDWLDLMRRTIAETLQTPLEHVYLKAKPRQRGLTQHERQSERRETIIAQEAGLRFEVNLTDYIDTGLFLDHRQTRAMMRELAPSARFLNLFCYTGSFTVYAAAGGASATTSVDLSNTYLEWARRNLELNGFRASAEAGAAHRLIRSDARAFLAQHQRVPAYDLAIVDPPTFSNSTMTDRDWDVQSGHVELLSALAPLMRPSGAVYFSTNFRRFALEEEPLKAVGYAITEISRRTVPSDFRNTRIHRCWVLRRT